MPRLEAITRLMRRWFVSLPLFALFGLILGGLISIPVISKPNVATVTISGAIMSQDYTDDILDILRDVREDNSIRAVVLQIDSPGGGASAIEQVYLEVIRLRKQKPVVTSVGTVAASGGYYIAVASNFIYAEPSSQLGSIGAFSSLPEPEELDESIVTTGPFKASGGSRRRAVAKLEMVRQEFVSAVRSQRGDRLRISDEELSRAEIYSGIESLRFGLIDEIGTRTMAIEKAASLAHLRNYTVKEFHISTPGSILFFQSSDMEELKSQASTMPIYYYLYFESE